ncbi:MAG: DUF2442 domain-containing protein [Candidatus Desantisbacteria bacterium]
MNTLATKITEQVGATNIRFVGNVLCVSLNDGREISIAIDQVNWLNWLAKATPKQRSKWSLEPRGFAVYWNELDDGIEIRHLLGIQPIAQQFATANRQRW